MGHSPELRGIMISHLEIEFFYRSSDRAHIRELHMIESALGQRSGTTFVFHKKDLDSASATAFERKRGVYFHRISPGPEKVMLRVPSSEAEIHSMLGFSFGDVSRSVDA